MSHAIEKKDFPIVCIGGSAGSLTAFCDFLKDFAPDTGVAVVIVNHIRRVNTHLHEILCKCTQMPVKLIREELKVEFNHVYIIPENRELYVQDNKFLLRHISKSKGWPNVITLFFKSIAENWNGKIIVGIVSGLDSDGVEALHQIKEAGGITFAQSPESAEVKEMPENAIKSGWIDYILTPEVMGREISKIASLPG